MKFVALLPVRDESDIITQCLDNLLSWADEVFVFDTGSVDETYEIVQDFAAKDRRVKLVGSKAVYFNDCLVRGLLFDKARDGLRDGDWFLRVDADEFHHVSPREFVQSRTSKYEGVVYHQYYDFCLTASEAEDWDCRKQTLADRVRPIQERRRHFIPSVYAEPRMCRYRSSMRWPKTASFPHNAGLVARARLPIRHYPNRDPNQMQRRCLLRSAMIANKENHAFWSNSTTIHWIKSDWRAFIVADDDPRLQYWKPGEPLPELTNINHLGSSLGRLFRFAFYNTVLPGVLDIFRSSWEKDAFPKPIEPEVVDSLREVLRQRPM
jgi:glycosyltransferase involved in cell wall biosynthesis